MRVFAFLILGVDLYFLKFLCYNVSMNKKFKWTLFLGLAVILTFLAAFLMKAATRATFAQGDDENSIQRMGEQNFVTFYDDGEKLTVKTEAKTVGEALERADIVINQGDIVEPSVETEINSNNYFVNIHRARPVMIRDGMVEKYLMSASFDAKRLRKKRRLRFMMAMRSKWYKIRIF